MAYRPAVGKKYAKLREEQQAMLAAAGKALAEDMSREHREQLAGAAAAVNAGRLNCQGITAAGHPALAGALESLANKSSRSPLDEEPSRSCGQDISEWLQLERIMEQAMHLQLAQLKQLRLRSAASENEPTAHSSLLERTCAARASPLDEEKPLKMSLDNIMETLKVARAAVVAGRKALLQAITGEVVRVMGVADVLRFRATSRLVQNATLAGGYILAPNLDTAPADAALRAAFLHKVALGFVRSICLPSDSLCEILMSQQELGFLEILNCPCGMGGRLAGLPLPRCGRLERLRIHGAGVRSLDSADISWLQELLESLSPCLKLLELEELATDIVPQMLEACWRNSATRPQRLVLRACVLPDSAVKCICDSLPEMERSQDARLKSAVLLEDCQITAKGDDHLLQALEVSCSCAISLSGGSRCDLACDVPEWIEEEAVQLTAEARLQGDGCASESLPGWAADPASSSSERPHEAELPAADAFFEPRRQYDHVNQMSTAELMAEVLKRMQEDVRNSPSQAAAVANLLLAKAEALKDTPIEPETFGGINDPSEDEEEGAIVRAGLEELREERSCIERQRAVRSGVSQEAIPSAAAAPTSWSTVD
mmetsp:Transcript_4222/g.9725  ORF Transcript_4222/g.9725 Transcript_4222/m.9725 type:complete len:601 (+) Transcript_4222:25-1827(+)